MTLNYDHIAFIKRILLKSLYNKKLIFIFNKIIIIVISLKNDIYL